MDDVSQLILRYFIHSLRYKDWEVECEKNYPPQDLVSHHIAQEDIQHRTFTHSVDEL